ncbi:MAG: DapH/DapD/GlmU-related protein [Spirochaetia bacterium]|jgi:carbonic anhydrase/acetyltransferase-like protein (isoleucine patch superfamily)
MTVFDLLSRSSIVKNALTLIVYAFYACVLGVSLAPSAALLLWAVRKLLLPALVAGAFPGLGPLVLFSLLLGVSAFVFFFFGLLFMGAVIRLLSLGIRPGRHDAASPTVLVWMVLNGVWTLAFRLILPMVPMTPVSMMFHRLSGCRIGRNVWINTISLVDAYMISIGDNTVIGGDAILSPHVYADGKLIIQRIRIGKDCLIGAHAYISPGVTVGDGCIVGMKAYVRRGSVMPPGTRITTVAGMPIRRALDLERGTYRKLHAAMKN